MRPSSASPSPSASKRRPELISHTTVAILGWILIGIGIGSAVPVSFGSLSIGAGAIGLLAWATFDATARRQRRDILAQLQALVEHRLERHVCQQSAIPPFSAYFRKQRLRQEESRPPSAVGAPDESDRSERRAPRRESR